MPLNADETELRAWIRLGLEPGLGPARIRRLLAVFGMPQDIYTASTGSLARHLDPVLATRLRQAPDEAVLSAVDKTLDWLREPGHHALTLADPLYPARLLELHDPPPTLFLNGEPGLLKRAAIAVVGARSATTGGAENAKAFAQYLSHQGWCIVSGLASGIDSAAHEGALNAGPTAGGTIAVLGSGIDIVYPARNRALAHRIAQDGLMVSEFPLGTRALPHHFPMRNRIVAALSRGVLVVEAARQSGSLITARLASELGREVFAIPGSIHSPLSRGCHALIRQGAKLVESGEDILEELRQSGPSPAPVTEATPIHAATAVRRPDLAVSGDEHAVLDALGHDPADAGQIQARLQWAMARVNAALAMLELQGVVARQPDGRFQRLA